MILRRRFWDILALLFLCAAFLTLQRLYGFKALKGHFPDFGAYLDAAHRVAAGQRPSADFRSPIGPLYFYVLGLGYRLGRGHISSMATLSAVAFPLYLAVMYALVRRRRSLAERLIVPAAIALALGSHTWINYNPLGYFLVLVALFVLGPGEQQYGNRQVPTPSGYTRTAVPVLALLLFAAFWLKATFAVAIALLIGLHYLLVGKRAVIWSIPAAAALVAASAALGLLNLQGYLRDLSVSSDIGRARLLDLGRNMNALFSSWSVVLSLLPIAAYASIPKRPAGSIGTRLRRVCWLLAIAAVQHFLVVSGATRGPAWDSVLAPYLWLLARDYASMEEAGSHDYPGGYVSPESVAARLLASMLIVLCSGFSVYSVARAFGPTALRHGCPKTMIAAGADLPALQGLCIPQREAVRYTEAVRFLRGHTRPGACVMEWSHSNFLAPLLGAASPRGACIIHYRGMTFSSTSFPPPRRILSRVDVVALPKGYFEHNPYHMTWRNQSPSGMPGWDAELNRLFLPFAELNHWTMLRRRNGSGATTLSLVRGSKPR